MGFVICWSKTFWIPYKSMDSFKENNQDLTKYN